MCKREKREGKGFSHFSFPVFGWAVEGRNDTSAHFLETKQPLTEVNSTAVPSSPDDTPFPRRNLSRDLQPFIWYRSMITCYFPENVSFLTAIRSLHEALSHILMLLSIQNGNK